MQKHILLVEDETIIAMAEAGMLRGYGFEVSMAHSAEKAIEMAGSGSIDLILMDIDLGKDRMDGTEAAGLILKEHDIPIVFLSSHTEKDIVERTEKITSYGYVVKNSGETVIIASIKMAFRLHQAHHDIVEAKRELQSSREQLLNIFNSTSDAVFIHDNEGRFLEANEMACTSLGYTRGELLGMTVRDVISGSAAPGAKDMMNRITGGEKLVFETMHVKKDGGLLPVEINSRSINYYGQTCILSAARDISERKKREDAVRESERQLQTLMSNLPGMAYRCRNDRNWTMEFISQGCLDLTGYEADELLGNRLVSYGNLIFEEDRDYVWNTIQKSFSTGYSFKLIYRIRTRSNAEKWVWEQGIGVFSNGDEIIHIEGFITDITEQQLARKRLSDVVEEKDFLMQELNHRIKNSLLMISSLIDLKADSGGGGSDLTDIRRQIDAIRIIHEKLYESSDISSINIKEYISDILNHIFGSFSLKPVKISNSIADIAVPTSRAVPLALIINEVATNAIQHGFGEEKVPEFSIELSYDQQQKTIVLTMSNTGASFPEDIDLDNAETIGLRLITALTAQLNGIVSLNKTPFPVYRISFPIDD